MNVRSAVAAGLVGLVTLSMAACGDDDDKGSTATTAAPDDTSAATTAAPDDTSAATTGDSGSTSGGDASEEDYLAAIEAQFTGTSSNQLQLTETEAKCVAPKWLDVITVDRLNEKGVTPDEIRSDDTNEDLATLGLSEDEGGEMVDAFGDCDVDLRAKFLETLSGGTDIPADAKDCIEGALNDDLLKRLFVVSITKGSAGLDQDEALSTEFTDALTKCAPTTTG